jgi:hypothetical protein
MTTALALRPSADFLPLRQRELREMLASGYAIDPDAIAGHGYRGISLGLPDIAVKLSWRTFQKTFHRLPDGRLVGWNVRVEQRGLGATSVAKSRKSAPWCFGFYEVVPGAGKGMPTAPEHALLIDYGLGGNGLFEPFRPMRDPLVALEKGSAERLLGWSYARFGPLRIPTPSYFLLEREGPIEHVPAHRWPNPRSHRTG